MEELRKQGHNVAGVKQRQQLVAAVAARQLQVVDPLVEQLLQRFPPPAQLTAGSPWALLLARLQSYVAPELPQARLARERAERQAERERLATPPCEEHGGEGGRLPSGAPRCAPCRRALVAVGQ